MGRRAPGGVLQLVTLAVVQQNRPTAPMDKAPLQLLQAAAPLASPAVPDAVLRCQAALLAHPRLEELSLIHI